MSLWRDQVGVNGLTLLLVKAYIRVFAEFDVQSLMRYRQ